jgi:MoaA/NifB/PqqE/SkfB family radical SAM enzyme
LQGENYSTEKIKSLLKIASERGIMDIDFSGGEPTIKPDFPELISYAKKLGFRNICVITNGIMMANKEYTQQLVDAGLNEVLFSIHGHNKKLHDYLTQVPGSFDRLMKSIKNIKRLGVRFRTNTTVTEPNYKYLIQFARLFLKLKPSAVNFILFNPFYSSVGQEVEMTCKFSECSPYIKKAIDILDPHIKKITVRCIPFCFMKDYEKYISDAYQNKYDCDEWLPRVQAIVEEVNILRHGTWGLFDSFLNNIFGYSNLKINNFLDSMVIWNSVRSFYTKPNECNGCKYEKICEGLKKGYFRVFGSKGLKTIKGEPIKDPMHFRGNYGNYGSA